MSLSVRWNRLRYRLYAPVYDRLTKPLNRGRRQAITLLELDPGDRVLIVGCGTGADLEYIRPGVDITAVDITPEMVRRTAQRAENLGHTVDARVMDARSLPFDENDFDAVIFHLVLSVVPNPSAVMSEGGRVLAPGGRMSVFDKFVAGTESPSVARRAVNPLARLLFSDLTRRLEPMVADADLTIETRTTALGGMYTVALLEK